MLVELTAGTGCLELAYRLPFLCLLAVGGRVDDMALYQGHVNIAVQILPGKIQGSYYGILW